MPSALTAPHPLSEFDLLAIGSVLVVVMAILGFRRLMRPPRPKDTEPPDWPIDDA